MNWGFPDSSVDKESTCNAGDPSSIPGLGRSPGEGLGYPRQSSWASLVVHLDKESACNVGDLCIRASPVKGLTAKSGDARNAGSTPGLGRSSGEGNGNPL